MFPDNRSTESCNSKGQWVKAVDCPLGCSNNSCIEKVCDEGAVRCSAGNYAVEKCQGNAWVKQDCAYKCFDRAEGATCEDKVCTEDAVQCKADVDNIPQKCVNNEWVDQAACNYKCMQDGCVEKNCDEGASRCEGSNQIVCNNNQEETIICKDGCSDNKCNDHICDSGYFQCSADGKSVQQCKNNTWTTSATCGTNEACSEDYSCVCAPGMTECNGECVDLNTDSNNCGKCGTKVRGCAGGESCTPNMNMFPPTSYAPKSCCDPKAERYVYLNRGVSCDDDDKFAEANRGGHSYQYCLTEEDIKNIPNSKNCVVSIDYESYLTDESKCGTSSADYRKCELVATIDSKKNPTVCSAGRCCFWEDDSLPVAGAGPNNTAAKYNQTYQFNKSDCCTGIAFEKTNVGGRWSFCTDDPEYYKTACDASKCPSGAKCTVDLAKKSCTISSTGISTKITML